MFYKYLISCTYVSRTVNVYIVNLLQRFEYIIQNYGFLNEYYYNLTNLFMMNYNISKIEMIVCCTFPHFVDN